MIGTTFKLGFDGTSVSRGLGNISSVVGRVGRQIGIGMAREVGTRMTDTLGRILSAVPESLAETMDWSGQLQDMSTQTGVSVKNLVELQEALRLSGAEGADTSRMISTLAANLSEAAKNGGPAADALRKLGLNAQEIAGMNIDQAFYTIGQRIAELTKTTRTPIEFTYLFGPKVGTQIVETSDKIAGLESSMADLFGARMGYKLIRFFKDFNGSMGQARNNVGDLASAMDGGLAARIDDMGDALGRWQTLKRSLGTMALDEVGRFGGGGGINRIFDSLDAEKFRPKIQELMSMLGRNLEVLLSQDLGKSFGDIFRNLGKSFGEGIKDSLKIDVKSLMPSLMGFGSGGKTAKAESDPALQKTNTLLSDIRREVGTARFA